MTPLTGVLLVGGASERFGAPKALARFRGETLAERGHRLLAEACDEVLVVGKQSDVLPLDVLDDGTASRAPVHGVIAGLRAARHDVAVVLPVDVPLMTPGALRALGDAAAVPSSVIPLPGAYPRALLPVLEARAAAGELSLRGVNPATLELPDGLLRDADTPDVLLELERPGHALVVGGTGMLAATTRALADRGHAVTCIARRAADLGDGRRGRAGRLPRLRLGSARRLARCDRRPAGRSSSRCAGSTPTHRTRRGSSRTRSPRGLGSSRSSAPVSGRSRTSRCTWRTARCSSARPTGAG